MPTPRAPVRACCTRGRPGTEPRARTPRRLPARGRSPRRRPRRRQRAALGGSGPRRAAGNGAASCPRARHRGRSTVLRDPSVRRSQVSRSRRPSAPPVPGVRVDARGSWNAMRYSSAVAGEAPRPMPRSASAATARPASGASAMVHSGRSSRRSSPRVTIVSNPATPRPVATPTIAARSNTSRDRRMRSRAPEPVFTWSSRASTRRRGPRRQRRRTARTRR